MRQLYKCEIMSKDAAWKLSQSATVYLYMQLFCGLRSMAHDPSSPSKLLVYQTNLVAECMTDLQSYWYEISGSSNLDWELVSCVMGIKLSVL